MFCQEFWIADPADFLVIHWWFVAIKCPEIDVGLNAAFMHSALRDACRWPFCGLGVPLCRLIVLQCGTPQWQCFQLDGTSSRKVFVELCTIAPSVK